MKDNELANNKLYILLFIDTIDFPLTNIQITEFFIKKYIMSYFDLQQLLSELVESDHLDFMKGRHNDYYSISKIGKQALALFKNRIDEYTKEIIFEYAEANRDRIKKESQLSSNYTRLDDNNYEVSLCVLEDDITLLDLKLNVINIKQAKSICSHWDSKAPEVYKKIMESLI